MFRILQQWVDYATVGRRKAAIAGDQLLVDAFKLANNSLFGEFSFQANPNTRIPNSSMFLARSDS